MRVSLSLLLLLLVLLLHVWLVDMARATSACAVQKQRGGAASAQGACGSICTCGIVPCACATAPSTSTGTQSAEKLRQEGNQLFSKAKFSAAIERYTEAILLCDKIPGRRWGSFCPSLPAQRSTLLGSSCLALLGLFMACADPNFGAAALLQAPHRT